MSAFAFSQTKIIFKLTIDISMRRIILEMEYFMKSMINQMLKFSRRIASFYREMILTPLFCFEDTKIQVYQYLGL